MIASVMITSMLKTIICASASRLVGMVGSRPAAPDVHALNVFGSADIKPCDARVRHRLYTIDDHSIPCRDASAAYRAIPRTLRCRRALTELRSAMAEQDEAEKFGRKP